MFYTVFPVFPKDESPDNFWNTDYMPQDFPTEREAKAYAKELQAIGIESDIEWSDGDYV